MVTGLILKPESKRLIAIMAIVSSAVCLLIAVTSIKIFFISVLNLVSLLFTIGGKERTELFESKIIGYFFASFSMNPYSLPLFDSFKICFIVYRFCLSIGINEKSPSAVVYIRGN